jgi:hypothetical protein
MWKVLTEMIDSPKVDTYTVVQNYFVRTYAATVCTAIRRESDNDSRTTSLTHCLQSLLASPESFTRERYIEQLALQTKDDRDTDYWSSGFDRFAPNGSDHIEPGVVEASLDRLRLATVPVKKYTNQVIAHRQRTNGSVEPVSVTFGEINHALDELGAIVKHYYSLRHPGSMLASLTPVVGLDFMKMFQSAWFPEGSVLALDRADEF